MSSATRSVWIPTTTVFVDDPQTGRDNTLVSRALKIHRHPDGTVVFTVSNPHDADNDQALYVRLGDTITMPDVADWLIDHMAGRFIRDAEEHERESPTA